MNYIIENWPFILTMIAIVSLIVWGSNQTAIVERKRKEESDKICDDFEKRIDDAITLPELNDIEDNLYGDHTVPNPFKSDGVLINMQNPERVKTIMLLISKKRRWITHHENNK